jgi:hypothetical protein
VNAPSIIVKSCFITLLIAFSALNGGLLVHSYLCFK